MEGDPFSVGPGPFVAHCSEVLTVGWFSDRSPVKDSVFVLTCQSFL